MERREPIRTEKHWIIDRLWTVHFYDYGDDLPVDDDGKDVAGQCYAREHTIHVYDDNWQTYFHEFLEAWKATKGYHFPHTVLVDLEIAFAGWVRANKLRLGDE